MKPDRNINGDGRGKYALILLRNMPTDDGAKAQVMRAIDILDAQGMLDYGEAESPSEFFVMRLKDRFAGDGLRAYSEAVAKAAQQEHDQVKSQNLYQWSIEVLKLSGRAGDMSPFCKTPD